MQQPLLTALLSFVGVLIGASITFLVGWLRLQHERKVQWQKWLLEATAEYATKLGGASEALRHAILSFEEERSVDERRSAVADAQWLVPEVRLLLFRLWLLFGEDSPVSKAAENAVENIDQAIKYLAKYDEPGGPDLEQAQAAQRTAKDHESKFIAAAAQEIRKLDR